MTILAFCAPDPTSARFLRVFGFHHKPLSRHHLLHIAHIALFALIALFGTLYFIATFLRATHWRARPIAHRAKSAKIPTRTPNRGANMEIVSVQPIPPRKPGANYRFAVVVKDGDEHLSVVMTPRGVRSRNVFERDFLGQTGRVFRWSGDVRVLLTGHESPADRETLAQVYGPDQMMLERDYVSPTEQMERLLTAHHAAKVLPPMRANEVLIGMDAQAKQAATINATGAAVK